MFEDDRAPDEFTGDADGEWHREIYDPIDLDPAHIVCGATVGDPVLPHLSRAGDPARRLRQHPGS